VPLAAVGLALAAAFLHALWNLLAARSKDTEAAMGVAMTLGPLLMLPFGIMRWRLEPEAIPYIAVSSALEFTYMVLLAAAYRRADVSLIYPIARGMAPVFVLVVGSTLLGQHLEPLSVLGIVTVGFGVLLVRGFRGAGAGAWRHVGVAVLIAAIIASYTLVDQQGQQYADPLLYSVLITGIPGSCLLALVTARGGVGRVRAVVSPSIVAAGVSGVSAYTLVLLALSLAPAAMVAAVRESSVVIATAMARFILHERVDRSRWIGAGVVALGVALVVLG
jgi:drug/metabolite transporter (DMT)-like permease